MISKAGKVIVVVGATGRRFMADEEWREIKRVTSAHAQRGDLVREIEDRLLVLTSYSPSVFSSKQR